MEQSELFRCAFLFGVFLGVYYDVYRLLRAFGFSSVRAVFWQDILFMTTSGVLCFMFAQTTVHGHFRFFIAAAHALGLLAYRFSVGIVTGYIYKWIGKVFKLFSKGLERIVKTAAKGIIKLFALLPPVRSFPKIIIRQQFHHNS